jgi:hypothetical protein
MSMNQFLKSFMVWTFGAVCGGLFCFAMMKPAADAMLAAETKMSEQLQDLYSQTTILYEPPEVISTTQAGPEIPLLNGSMSLRLNIAGTTQRLAPGKTWSIPMKVKPGFAGDPTRVQIFYIDVKTHQMSGPFPPSKPQ